MPSDATSVTSNVSQRDNVLLILEFFFQSVYGQWLHVSVNTVDTF